MTSNELRTIISQTLFKIGKWSQSAENLLIGTAAHESGGFRYRRQVNGPALGLFQIEPITHNSIRTEWAKTHPEILDRLDEYLIPGHDAVEQLVDNDHYAAGICRLKYAGIKEPLPDAYDIPALASYWLRYYNAGGKGTEQKFIDDYRRYVSEPMEVA